MNEKSLNQLASRLGYGLLSKKLGEVVTDMESATSSNKPTKLAPRDYLHTPEQIAKVLRVDEAGNLWWIQQKVGRSRPRVMNKPVGSFLQNGSYIQFGLDGTKYLAHTVCWVLYYGKWPERSLDHIDGNTLNNRKDNLREVSYSENKHNQQKLYKSNTTGYSGITYSKRDATYMVRLSISNTRIYAGTFNSLERAIVARISLEKKYGVHAHSLLGKQFIGGIQQYETT